MDEETGRMVVSINYPEEQAGLLIRDAAHLLIAGASLLVKACSKKDVGIKDYELVSELVNHLTSEFSSTDSYEDIKIERK